MNSGYDEELTMSPNNTFHMGIDLLILKSCMTGPCTATCRYEDEVIGKE